MGLLIREGEGLTVEFKQRYTSRIDEDIVAFANTKGGVILLGVRDDGAVVGEKLTNDLKGRINSLSRNCKPAVAVEAAQVGNVVVIEVAPGTEKPYSCGSGYFRRLNGNTQKMGHEEIRIMFREYDVFPFEERSAQGFGFEDVSKSKVRAFALEAGILFFGGEVHDFLPQAQMALLAFKGATRVHIYDRRDVREDLPAQFQEAMRFLERHLITGTQISVDIFDDRVEIVNPGGLPKGLEQKALGKGISIRRNELVADLFARIHKVERAGTGIQRMRQSLAAAGLKEPDFETDGFFRTVFHRSPEYSLAAATQKITQEIVRKIMAAIRRNPEASREKLALSVGISADGIKYHLRLMQQRAIIRRIGPDKGGRWEIIEDAHAGD